MEKILSYSRDPSNTKALKRAKLSNRAPASKSAWSIWPLAIKGLLVVIFTSIGTAYMRPQFDVHPSGVVVITGASTGIGASAALKLSALGYTVLAGVRRLEDGEALRKKANWKTRDFIVPTIIDVTNVETIDSAVREAQRVAGESGVVGVVCNAGISAQGGLAPVEFSSAEADQRVFAVNYFGVVETVKRFLPLIRDARGRIVIVGSVAGNVASPFQQPYSASKFAVRSIADSLRRELKPAGVSVSRVEPGFIETPILTKQSGHGTFSALQEGQRAPYLSLYDRTLRKMRKLASKASKMETSTDLSIQHALTAARPQAVYHPGNIGGKPASVVTGLFNFLNVLDPAWADFMVEVF